VLGGTFQVGLFNDGVFVLVLLWPLPLLPDDGFDDLFDLLDLEDPSEDLDDFSLGVFFLSPEPITRVLVEPGAGAANKSRRLLTYALSALATGSPSLRKLMNKLFLSCGRHSTSSGFCKGIRLTGGVPNVMQCTRLKHDATVFNSLMAAFDVANMWL
jgi:hypothetical protein